MPTGFALPGKFAQKMGMGSVKVVHLCCTLLGDKPREAKILAVNAKLFALLHQFVERPNKKILSINLCFLMLMGPGDVVLLPLVEKTYSIENLII